jgi:hypothetical protein
VLLPNIITDYKSSGMTAGAGIYGAGGAFAGVTGAGGAFIGATRADGAFAQMGSEPQREEDEGERWTH